LSKNLDKINWCGLSYNSTPEAIQLLSENKDKIDWFRLSLNSGIFSAYNYKKMKINCLLFKEDLMKNRFHPRNIPKFRDWGIDGFEDYEMDD
jgi:hypothetical protein